MEMHFHASHLSDLNKHIRINKFKNYINFTLKTDFLHTLCALSLITNIPLNSNSITKIPIKKDFLLHNFINKSALNTLFLCSTNENWFMTSLSLI